MPPKKVKDLAEAPVYKMVHDEQVQLLSDALLREYMHRRGFRATLKAFDEEHPRDDNTISSRAVMSDLMALQADDQQRMKGQGIETIMEMLCNLRVERRVEAEKLTAAAEAPLPKVPAKYDALEAKLQERAARASQKAKSQRAAKQRAASSTDAAADTAASKQNKKRRPPPTSKDAHHNSSRRAVADMTIEDLLGGSPSSSNSGGDSDGADDRRDGSGRRHSSTAGTAGAAAAGRQSSSPSPKATKDAAGVAASGRPVQPAWMELGKRAAGSNSSDASEDDDDGESDGDDSAAAGGDAVSAELRDELSAAFQLLCGFDGGLARFFTEQGFVFDEALDCGLIQWQRGACDAVVAPIQAFVAAYFYEREVYVRKEQRQQDCLLRALSTSLEQAQPNASKVVLIDGAWRLKKGAARLTRAELRQQADSSQVRCWTQLSSAEEVRQVLRDSLLTSTRWRKSKGCGLLNFVFSLLLSRGVDVVRKELASAAAAASASDERPALLSSSAADGDIASFALANLVLAGRATPYRHNGVRDGNRMGYPAKLKCGMLVADHIGATAETSVQTAAYTHAAEPHFPSWVLRHKGHYANLYMTKDTRQVFQQKLNLGGSASEDVVYWDAATEDDAFTLSLTVRSVTLSGGGGHRNAKSFVNAAITSVPVWAAAEVNWNGDAPLRD